MATMTRNPVHALWGYLCITVFLNGRTIYKYFPLENLEVDGLSNSEVAEFYLYSGSHGWVQKIAVLDSDGIAQKHIYYKDRDNPFVSHANNIFFAAKKLPTQDSSEYIPTYTGGSQM